MSVATASVADCVQPIERVHAFALLMAIASAGFVLSSAISTTLNDVRNLQQHLIQLDFFWLLDPNLTSCLDHVHHSIIMVHLCSDRNAIRR